MWQGVIARNGDTDARGILLVAEDAEGSIVGFASSGTEREPGSGSDSELYAIYLLKRAQGCGTGRALFERTIQALWARGFRTMRLWVLETNPTRKFYEAFSGRKGLETKFVDMGGAALREVSYRFDLNRQIDIRELSDDEYQEHFKQWGPIIFDRN
jgi:L-amino acid N-acyltransferase YncA